VREAKNILTKTIREFEMP